MVAAGNPEGIEGPDDLAGKNVCSVEGSTPAQNIRDNYPEATLTLFDVYSKCADALNNGQVDAVTTDNVILTGLVASNPDGFELVGNPFTEEPYGIGLALGDTEFRDFINDTLEASFEDGSWAAAWDATAGAITGEAPPSRRRSTATDPPHVPATPTRPATPSPRSPRGGTVQFFMDNIDLFRDAFLNTLGLTFFAGVLALVLGTVLAGMRVSPIAPLRGLSTAYVEIFRNTPLTVVFFFVIFGLPQIDTVLPFFTGAVVAVGTYTAAFVAEAIRSGINSVAPGQAEAARALGLTFSQTLSTVVLPQAFRTVVPPLGSVLIAMAKNTSIAAGFSISEVSSLLARLTNADPNDLLLILLGVVLAYMIITVPAAVALNRIERRVAILR